MSLVNWLLSGLLLSVCVLQGYWISTFAQRRDPPIQVFEVVAAPTEIKQGAPLRLKVTILRNRLCLSDIDRFVMKASDNTIMLRARIVGPSFGITATPDTQFAYVPLNNLEPGDYIYRGIIYSNCGVNDFHGVQQPDVPFKVVPP